MVGKEKNNHKDTTKAKQLACLLVCVCACARIYENVIAKSNVVFFHVKKKEANKMKVNLLSNGKKNYI